MERKNIGIAALLAGIAATSITVHAEGVKPENPFIAEQKIQPGKKIVIAYGQLPCTSQQLAYMRRHGFTPMCN